jgi:peptidyl-dipeptidase Dcp
MLVSLFNDVIGPVMRGPSKSHCAAALRLGRLSRGLVGGAPDEVLMEFDRAGSRTGRQPPAARAAVAAGDDDTMTNRSLRMTRAFIHVACMIAVMTPPFVTTASPAATATANPLLAPWAGPYGGVPPFDLVRVEHFEPALEAGMAEQLAAIDRIVATAEAPTFANTVAAYERSSRTLDRVMAVYNVFAGCMSDDALQAVERKMAPRLAACRDRIVQNAPFFARLAAVHEKAAANGLTAQQQRLAWLHVTTLAHAGARLDAAAKAELAGINQQLAELHTTFAQHVLREENSSAVVLEAARDLEGLPESSRRAAADAAAALGRSRCWAIPNTRSTVEPFLTYANRRDLRERVWRMFVDRGDGGGANDNNATVTRILALRARRARLLGFPTHAHWRLEDSMAKSPDRAVDLMEAVWKPAVARVREEVADMQAIACAEQAGITISAWDYRYYAEKVRKAKYDLDEAEITPYLQLENLREGMFFVAERLFGLRFVAVAAGTVPVYHPDVRVWEVQDAAGMTVGLWYFDPFARAGKRSGAWMSDERAQERFDGRVLPIVSNNCNFVKPPAGEPALLSWDDATTLFHEFGHALHGLCSDVEYPSLAGTRVARDYVEFPSQILEHWLATPEVLDRFAVHCETGRPIPPELVAKIQRAATFNEGFRTVEFLASAIVDMKLHLAGETPIDPERFEPQTLETLGMPAEIVMRHRTPHFNHIFADDGYSAGYYSYLWADTLTADAWEAFTEAGGPWDQAVADRLRRHVFSAGNTVDPEEGYRAFRGRDPRIDGLMRKRGFAPPR